VDANRFDHLTLVLGEGSSRRRVGLLLAAVGLGASLPVGSETDARKKRCPPCRFKKNGKCKGKKPDGTACGDGFSCLDGRCTCLPAERECPGEFCCPEGQVCDVSRTQCANPGACAPVATLACVGQEVTCNGSASCSCLRDVDGATHCGTSRKGGSCNECVDNDDCVTLTGVVGAFCVESGSNACCSPGQRFCRLPCP
jgi:hypothetical protein